MDAIIASIVDKKKSVGFPLHRISYMGNFCVCACPGTFLVNVVI